MQTVHDNIGRLGMWLSLSAALAVVAFLGYTADEENSGPGSPLYRIAVEESVREQNKREDAPPEPSPRRSQSPKDTAILAFIETDRSAALPGTDAVYVYWTEDAGEFRRTPPREDSSGRESAGQYFVFWSDKDGKFMQVPSAKSAEVRRQLKKGRGVSISRSEVCIYVRWCKNCNCCHKDTWRLRDSQDLVPIEVIPGKSATRGSASP